jgi:hypothetical protein
MEGYIQRKQKNLISTIWGGEIHTWRMKIVILKKICITFVGRSSLTRYMCVFGSFFGTAMLEDSVEMVNKVAAKFLL